MGTFWIRYEVMSGGCNCVTMKLGIVLIALNSQFSMPVPLYYSGFLLVFIFSHSKMLLEHTILKKSLVESSLFLSDTVFIFSVMYNDKSNR